MPSSHLCDVNLTSKAFRHTTTSQEARPLLQPPYKLQMSLQPKHPPHRHVPGAAVDWEFYPLLQRSNGVRVAGADLRWLDWDRWSQHQNAAMKLGGLVGSLTLEGDLSPIAPLLRAAEIPHAIKGAVLPSARPS